MRILVTIAHYFKHDQGTEWHERLGSADAPLAKIAALNAQIVALHRYFGPRRLSVNPDDAQARSGGAATVLDIVVMTMPQANLLPWIGIDQSVYSVEHFDGPPSMLAFEAQRVMRERVGHYDLYAYMEDDLIVDDPAFFAKVAWFAAEFGPRALLLPIRYEMASTGTPAKVSISIPLPPESLAPFRRAEFVPVLTGRWNGTEQAFRLPHNPHVGCHVLTDAQLRLWIEHPSFYDRDARWIDPLVSACTHAPGKVFGLYTAAEPDPWFLQIEHFGTRYAARLGPAGHVYGEPLLLSLAEAVAAGDAGSFGQMLARLQTRDSSIIARAAEAARLHVELNTLRRSRSRLFKALMAAILRKRSG